MNPTLALLALLAPAALFGVALVSRWQPGRDARAVLRASGVAGVTSVIVAIGTATLVALYGPQSVALPVLGQAGFMIRLDPLSATMLLLVAFLGAVILRFSRNYLEGDARQGAFCGRLALTVACVMMLVLSGHLVHLVVFWTLTSAALHGLLLFYRERPAARAAARKKWVVARAGDLCLAVAALLLWRAFGTGDLGLILEQAAAPAQASGVSSASLLPATLLVAFGAVLKSAVFPTHGWLAEVVETPTPVSALLHAGIINGGTFLVVRLGEVMLLTPAALHLLVVVGGITALFGSIVLTTQSSIKVALAYSSTAHMGFMLMFCGFGAFAVAILHLVAHSFYKAHAFLSSGDAAAVAPVREESAEAPSFRTMAVGLGLSMAVVGGLSWLLGISVVKDPVTVGLATIFVLGVAHLWIRGLHDDPSPRVLGRIGLMAMGVTLAFLLLEEGAARVLAGAVPSPSEVPGVSLALLIGMVGLFSLAVLVQLRLPALQNSPGWGAVHTHLMNGLYANAWLDRLLGAYRGSAPAAAHGPATAGSADSADPVPSALLLAQVDQAVRRVAPVWPLKRFVAVNPWLGLDDHDVEEAADRMARVAGARMTLPRRFYLEAMRSGRIRDAHLEAALERAHARTTGRTSPRGAAGSAPESLPGTVDALRARVLSNPDGGDPRSELLPTVADVAARLTGIDWDRVVTGRISQWAAAHFDQGQAQWRSPFAGRPAWAAWKAASSHDRTPEILGLPGFRGFVQSLPDDPHDAILALSSRLDLPPEGAELYFHRLLMSVGGWSAWARYHQWEAEVRGTTEDLPTHLLAVRLAFDVALLEAFSGRGIQAAWQAARGSLGIDPGPQAPPVELQVNLVLQEAFELGWQETMIRRFEAQAQSRTAVRGAAVPGDRSGTRGPASDRPDVHAVFCIDVRSEVLRRALEAQSDGIRTAGFAGFFGFPLEVIPVGSATGTSACPVLLAPSMPVREIVDGNEERTAHVARNRSVRSAARRAWSSFRMGAVSCFGFVAPVGLAYAARLLGDALGWSRPAAHPDRESLSKRERARLAPSIVRSEIEGRAVGLAPDERLAAAEAVLRAMGLTEGLARVILLAGHGSTSANNPHATGLDCGACGGRTGEANARVAAEVLNDPEVRRGLAARGHSIPPDTWFLAGLHDTTTDRVTLFDLHAVPSRLRPVVDGLERHLAAAGALARAERATALLPPGTPGTIRPGRDTDRQLLARSRDGSQVRPEWGLAGCAVFVAAPRDRTLGMDLGGRSFLHDYAWRRDPDFGVLELIMTAPMVVASWISLQYYGSVVDNRVHGSGNKTLHNVVGRLGVLEGHGGDLRVGLPWQSVHDGRRLVHEPLRLNVVVEAPREAMNAILARHPQVARLLDHRWLHLWQMDESGALAWRYDGSLRWTPVKADSPAPARAPAAAEVTRVA